MKLLRSIVWLLFVAGCATKKPIQSIRNTVLDHQEEVIAKFAELPDAPFQAQLEHVVVDPQSHNQAQIFYVTSMAQHDVMHFYEQQMERLGWRLTAQSTLQDYVLQYTKPQEVCLIIIKQGSVTLYMSKNQALE